MSNSVNQFAEELMEELRPETWPLYVGMVIVIAWLTYLSIFIFSTIGASPDEVESFIRPAKVLMYTFAVLPWAFPVGRVVIKRRFR